MKAGERQVAPDLTKIRRDHVARYEWARDEIRKVRPYASVIDVACGVGYGSHILAESGCHVTAIDIDADAIEYAKKHWSHKNITYLVADASTLTQLGRYDVAVCFETIEHLKQPLTLLQALRCAPVLLASVPNEDVFPFKRVKFHYRHYTKSEFNELLVFAGFKVSEWFGQEGPHSEVCAGVNGRTLVVKAERSRGAFVVPSAPVEPKKLKTVCIVGLGPSVNTYLGIVKALGSRKKLADEVWAINALGDSLQCDRVFHMDDVRIQQIRADADPTGNIAAMLTWMKTHPGPIYTSRKHPDYPGLIDYPLADVINACDGQCYFNSTAAYAVAYAVFLRVDKIQCFGMDFTYPNAHSAEKGRGCVEHWLGFARGKGIDVAVAKTSTLLDAYVKPEERFYGYDTLNLEMSWPAGKLAIKFTERETLPTAAEIEERYDHTKHPSALVREAA